MSEYSLKKIGGIFLNELYNRISKEKQNRIMQSAIAEFASSGYDQGNTNKIAQNADISVGSLYKYFNSKEELFLETVKYGATHLKLILEEILNLKGDILFKLEKLIRKIQDYSKENPDMIRLYNEVCTHSNSKIVSMEALGLESFTSKLYSTIIEDGKKSGEIRSDCDSNMFAFLLDNIFMMLQFSYSCDYYKERFKTYLDKDIFDKDDFVVDQILKFIKAAFKNH